MKPMEINLNEIENYVAGLNKCSSNVEGAVADNVSSFSCLNSSGLYCNGINLINDGMKKISQNISSLNNLIECEKEEIFINEEKLARKAEELEVPKDFIVNYENTSLITENVLLTKNNGQAIKKNVYLSNEDLEFNSSIEFNKKLNNIYSNNKNNEESKIEDQEFNKIEKEELINIQSNLNLKNPQLEDDYLIEKKNLQQIKKDYNQKDLTLSNPDISKKDLYNPSKEGNKLSSNNLLSEEKSDFV